MTPPSEAPAGAVADALQPGDDNRRPLRPLVTAAAPAPAAPGGTRSEQDRGDTRGGARETADAAAEPASITVTIDRIDVHAAPVPARPVPRPPRRPPLPPLADYVRARGARP